MFIVSPNQQLHKHRKPFDRATTFCTVVSNISWCSKWNLLHKTILNFGAPYSENPVYKIYHTAHRSFKQNFDNSLVYLLLTQPSYLTASVLALEAEYD